MIDRVKDFQFFLGTAGGCGSGLGNLLISRMRVDFGKANFIT